MVKEIEINKLKIHPKNVRKQYEGIDELAASIKEKGVLQNLTVVPSSEEEGVFLVVIGNRRLKAAIEAGLKTVPCEIKEMEEKEQATTMLTENMNRKDLKVYEEAAAMQMCLADYGFSVEDIAKETGLSQTTVNHRLNVAKLNSKVLAKKVEDPEFQMTLTDLQSLEKVEDVKTRNKILEDAENSRDLANRARQAAKEETRAKHQEEYIKLFESKGIAAAPAEADRDFYTPKWNTVARYDLDEKVAKQIKVNGGLKNRELFYLPRYGTIYILEKQAKQKRELSDYEKKQKELEKARRDIKTQYKLVVEDMRQFVMSIIDGKTPPLKDTEQIEDELWAYMMSKGAYIQQNSIVRALLGKRDIYAKNIEPEDREKAIKKAEGLSRLHQMMALCVDELLDVEVVEYDGKYRERGGQLFKMMYDCLKKYGYSYADDNSKAIVEGTHELYKKPEGGEEDNDVAGKDVTYPRAV